MTELLEQAIEHLKSLGADQQDAIAALRGCFKSHLACIWLPEPPKMITV